MDKWLMLLRHNRMVQLLWLAIYILVTAASLFWAKKSILAFLLLLLSLLLLYYSNLGNRLKWIVGAVVLVFVLPLAASGGPAYQSYMEVASQVGIYIAMALGLNIVVGFAGLLDLGFVAFFALGAYTYGIFATGQASQFMPFGTYPVSGESFWVFILLGCFVAALFGVILGLPVLRVKGDYLAIVTLGFGEIIRIVFNNLDKPVNITNGAMGLSSIKPPELWGITFLYPNQFYFIVLGILVIVLVGVKQVEHSRWGRAMKAVRENEIAAQAMGIPLIRTKLMAFAIGASFSGMMGVVFAAKQTFIDPTSFTLLESITILVMVLMGGMGSVPGVVLGAGAVTVLNLQILTELTNWMNQLSLQGIIHVPDALAPAKMQRFIFGIILIGFTIYRPNGLIPARNRTWEEQTLREASKPYCNREKEPIAPSHDAETILQVNGLSKRFGELIAVGRVDLEVKKGSITAVIGPNGAGKTTFFNMITGIYPPDEGSVKLNDKLLIGLRPDQIAALGVTRTFQNIRLFGNMSVLENVMAAMHCRLKANIISIFCRLPSVRREEMEVQAEAYRLLEYVGLSSLLNETAQNLPYGAQRRLEIARALATQPKILLLDEPAAGMNPRETSELTTFIRKMRAELDLTIILIEHDMKLVMEIAEHILVLDYGEKIAEGKVDEIRNHPKVIEAYLGKGAADALEVREDD